MAIPSAGSSARTAGILPAPHGPGFVALALDGEEAPPNKLHAIAVHNGQALYVEMTWPEQFRCLPDRSHTRRAGLERRAIQIVPKPRLAHGKL